VPNKTVWLGAWQGTTQQTITERTETMMDWTSAVPPALLELTLKGWINVGFIALIVLIAAVAAILGRVPQSSIDKIPGAPQP
jgi:hypothetical protein